MGDEPKSQIESTKELLDALREYGPGAIRSIADTTPYTAQKQLEVQQQTAPGYAQLQTDVYGKYGPELNRIGSDINRQNQLATAGTEAAVAAGPGAELVNVADKYQRQIDPEFYKSRAVLGNAIENLFRSYNPNELSPTELEQINRGLAANNGPQAGSAMNTIRNAQAFGDAATKKWQGFGDVVTKVASTLPGLKSGMTGFEIATRRPLTSNSGEQRLGNPQNIDATSAFNTNFGFANNILSETAGLERANVAKRRDFDERVNQAIGSLSGII